MSPSNSESNDSDDINDEEMEFLLQNIEADRSQYTSKYEYAKCITKQKVYVWTLKKNGYFKN